VAARDFFRPTEHGEDPMNAADVLDVSRDAIIVTMQVSAPLMAIALIVGVTISLFQALTQIQEMTLVFVPKILAVFAGTLALIPFMLSSMTGLMERIADRIVNQG